MFIPAEAFVHGAVRNLARGQLLTRDGAWFLLTGMVQHNTHFALALNGNLRGSLCHLQPHDTAFAVAAPFRWRPMLRAAPSYDEAAPGSLFIGPQGPVFRSWSSGHQVYAFDHEATDVTGDFPHNAASISRWSMGLYRDEAAESPICELFEVDVAPQSA